ncbi:MAG: aminodeoxychorismate lyase [Steroidobacteraceae bacterium]
MTATLVNGIATDDSSGAIAVDDRGLNYGDGLFETMLCQNGTVRLLDAHLQRLTNGCARLGITATDDALLREEIRRVSADQSGVVKIVITRGAGGRGYRPPADLCTTRIVSLRALPAPSMRSGVNVRWCEMRLGRNAVLAGMKHLNRLEQVLAQREWTDPAIDPTIDEGFMRDTEGELVCATMSNVFIVRRNEILTPDLRFCGVRGVMRGEVLRLAREQGIAAREMALWPQDVDSADEIFITNAVRGVRSVTSVGARHWAPGPITQVIAAGVNGR